MTALATTTLFFMMLALGMTLRLEDFRRVVSSPRAVCAGLVGQLVLLPLIAFAIAHAFALPARFAIGMMLVAACPGGATSNLFSLLARGDVALSITLTAAFCLTVCSKRRALMAPRTLSSPASPSPIRKTS